MVDANILIAGSLWPRWPYEVLQHALRGDFRLVVSAYVLQQARRHIEKRIPAHAEAFEQFLVAGNFEVIADPGREDVLRNLDLVRDPSDVPVALAAIQAGVDYLVSEDKDLTAQDETTARLRQKIRVLIAGTFLREVMGWSSQELERTRSRTWRDLPALNE